MTRYLYPPLRAAMVAALLLALTVVSAQAQLQTGNIFGTVVSSDGSALPGVTVTLTGVGAPQVTVADGQGRFRFINLSPATYALKAELAGYGTAARSGVTVNIGRNAEVTLQLNPSVSDTITVTAEAPLLDVRRTGTGATVTETELEQVPTARDPWVILQQVPGVLMDRINVGGNESGQQSNFVSKGTTGDQTTYSVDGVNSTDMIATGASADYFDFGSFEEIQVSTGGSDPRVMTPGAQINIVTKRGTNDFSGSGRYYLTPGSAQAEASVPTEAAAYLERTNEINDISEWGLEAGGPVIRDHLWAWAAYAKNDIKLFVAQPKGQAARYKDDTVLETVNAKLNGQITRNNSAVFFYYNNDKTKLGRDASPTRPPDTVWNQGAFGPAGNYKLEDTHIFSSSFYLTGLYSKVNGGFSLYPDQLQGCTDLDCVRSGKKPPVVHASTNAWQNSYLFAQGVRPQDQVRVDGSAFFNTGSLSHELKFGFGYRTAGAEGQSGWGPFDYRLLDYDSLFGLPKGFGIGYFYAFGPYDYDYKYNDAYVGDTILFGNLTLQGGLRFDTQKGSAPAQHGPANSLIPEFLPALSRNDIPSMEWESISPRLGLTYALGEDKKTLIRAAYNRYVGQLGSNSAGYASTIPVAYRYMAMYVLDGNYDQIITRDEILFDEPIVGFFGMNPLNPKSTESFVRIDPDVEPDHTDEFVLGFEREVLNDLVLGVNYTRREMNNFLWFRGEKTPGAGDYFTSADYELIGNATNPKNADGTSRIPEVPNYSIPVYQLKEGLLPPQLYTVLTNRDGYSQTYDGLELSFVKRMSNRWMLRANASFNDHQQHVEDQAIVDPTVLRAGTGCSVCDGSDVTVGSGGGSGPKGGVWINSKWAINAAGVYQIPFIEANFGLNFTMRQGYPVLYVHQFDTTEGEFAGVGFTNRKNVLIPNEVTNHRLPNPYSLDLRLSKDLRFKGVGFELSLDAFNVTNQRTILQRDATIARNSAIRPAHNNIRELQSPRVLRLGARFTF